LAIQMLVLPSDLGDSDACLQSVMDISGSKWGEFSCVKFALFQCEANSFSWIKFGHVFFVD
jgi:hypothetical protein